MAELDGAGFAIEGWPYPDFSVQHRKGHRLMLGVISLLLWLLQA